MRFSLLLATAVLAGCDMLIERDAVVGSYSVNSDANGSLILKEDGTYAMEGEGVDDSVGEWTLERAYGDARLAFRSIGGNGVTYHDVQLGTSGNVVLIIGPRNLTYLKDE